MMTNKLSYALNAYRSSARNVPPLVGVVQLYDVVLRRIGNAIKDIPARRVEDCYVNITKACLVLRGLSRNLDFDQGLEMADMLKSTYVANMIELHNAFGKLDAPSRFLHVMEGLLDLRNAWAGLASMKEMPSLPQDICDIVSNHDKTRQKEIEFESE